MRTDCVYTYHLLALVSLVSYSLKGRDSLCQPNVPGWCHLHMTTISYPDVWFQMICRVGRAVRGSLDNSSVIESMNSLSLAGASAAQTRQVPLSRGQSYSKGTTGSRRSIEKKAEEAAQKR